MSLFKPTRIPLTARVMMATSLSLALAIAALVFTTTINEIDDTNKEFSALLQIELDTVPNAIIEDVITGDINSVQRTLMGLVKKPHTARITFSDGRGADIIAEEKPENDNAPAWFSEFFRHAAVNGETAIISGGKKYGTVSVSLTTIQKSNKAWDKTKKYVAILFFVSFVDFLGVLSIFILSSRSLKKLGDSLDRFADGDFSARVGMHGGPPEIAKLTERFDRMAEIIETSRKEISDKDRNILASLENVATEKRRLDDIINATDAGTWEWNVSTGELALNDRWITMLGYSREELSPITINTWRTLAHPEDLKKSDFLVKQHLDGIVPFYEFETRMRKKNGEWAWIIDHGKVVSRRENGDPLVMSGTHIDISERKAMEEQHLDTLSILNASIEQNPVGIVIAFPDGNAKLFNKIARTMLGIKGHEVGISVKHIAARMDQSFDDSPLAKAILHGEITLNEEIRMDDENGKSIIVSANASPIKHESEIIGGILVMRDITEDRIKSIELENAKRNAESANLAKSSFLATMSHEIRTPMNGILGMAQLIHEDPKNGNTEDYAKTILDCGETLLTLLNDILDLSKVESGKMDFSFERFNPSLLIDETIRIYVSEKKKNGNSVSWSWDGDSNTDFIGDQARIRQMLGNLISNAVKFTKDGEVKVGGSVSESGDGKHVVKFFVKDTGIGIPDEKKARMFQPFSQGDGSITREYGGTGLGLSIVAKLSKALGGDFGFSSNENLGSEFWFTVKVEDAKPEKTNDAANEHIAKNEKREESRKPSVLVVEDNMTNMTVIRAFLKRLEVEHSCCSNGEEAVNIISNGARFDIVFMDIHMPVMDGLEATKAIRRIEENSIDKKRQRIIAVTADAFQQNGDECIAAGMDGFISKPVNFQKIKSCVFE